MSPSPPPDAAAVRKAVQRLNRISVDAKQAADKLTQPHNELRAIAQRLDGLMKGTSSDRYAKMHGAIRGAQDDVATARQDLTRAGRAASSLADEIQAAAREQARQAARRRPGTAGR